MMASRSCSMRGSGTLSQRMSAVPCQTNAFIPTSSMRGCVPLHIEQQVKAFVPIEVEFCSEREGRLFCVKSDGLALSQTQSFYGLLAQRWPNLSANSEPQLRGARVSQAIR